VGLHRQPGATSAELEPCSLASPCPLLGVDASRRCLRSIFARSS
jgi:hypothetical protein